MSHRHAVDFLRRRYAAAILCDDADTACRLRAQLDGIMNAGPAPGAAPAGAEPTRRCDGARAGAARSFVPRVYVTTPVTGLLATRRPLPRAAGPAAWSDPSRHSPIRTELTPSDSG